MHPWWDGILPGLKQVKGDITSPSKMAINTLSSFKDAIEDAYMHTLYGGLLHQQGKLQ